MENGMYKVLLVPILMDMLCLKQCHVVVNANHHHNLHAHRKNVLSCAFICMCVTHCAMISTMDIYASMFIVFIPLLYK